MYTVATDHLTGSNAVSTSSGALEELMDYYPYGSPRLDEKAGNFNEKRKFAGHEYDSDTGLFYMVARYYDGGVGRFTSQDPAFWDSSHLSQQLIDPQSWNSYAYARNNPMRYVDLDGLFWNELWNAAKDAVMEVAGYTNAVVSNAFFGLGRHESENPAYQSGQTTGDQHSIAIGVAETLLGGAVAVGGGTLTATVGGAVVGVPAVAGGLVLAGHGLLNAATGARFFSTDDNGYGDSNVQKTGRYNRETQPGGLSGKSAREAAKDLGYSEAINPNKAGIDTKGKPLFKNPKTGEYISPDRNAHSGGTWKTFDKKGGRTGTADDKLNKIGK